MRLLIGLSVCALLSGCAGTDTLLRSERTTFVRTNDESQPVKIYGEKPTYLQCLKWHGGEEGRSPDGPKQCLYYATSMKNIFNEFSTAQPDENTRLARNRYLSFLLGISEDNCSTFLGRAFANKSSSDTGRNILQDVLTGTSAATANASPHTAAGLGLVNLVVGKSVDNLNSSFYFEQTFQALAAAVGSVRDDIKADILEKQKKPYVEYTIFDAVSDTRRYDDACSIRVGLAKLQDLAQDAKKIKEENSKTVKSLAEKSTQLDLAQKEIADLRTKLQEAGKLDGKINETLADLKDTKLTKKMKAGLAQAMESRARISQEIADLEKRIEEIGITAAGKSGGEVVIQPNSAPALEK